jgi:hypothetical protein
MTSHLLVMLVFSLLVSTVFGVLLRDEPRAQFVVGVKMFAAFVGTAILLGWLMYPLPL